MKELVLSKGYIAILDDEDYEWASRNKWCARVSDGNVAYAMRRITVNSKSVYLYLHRQILQAPQGMQVDHINRNTLDNTRINLRLVTASQNVMNTRRRSDNTSGHRGVWQNVRTGRWTSQIKDMSTGKRKHLGVFLTLEEAVEAYKKAAVETYGEYACIE